jgi:hypothetical protein
MKADPKFCKDCKHFWPSENFRDGENAIRHGYCLLSLSKTNYQLVTGPTEARQDNYNLAVYVRSIDLCGPSAKLFEPKSPSEALTAKPKPQSNWFRRLFRL